MKVEVEEEPFTGFETGELIKSPAQKSILTERIEFLAIEANQTDPTQADSFFNRWRDCADHACLLYDQNALEQLLGVIQNNQTLISPYNKPWLTFYKGELFATILEFTQAIDCFVKTVPEAQRVNNLVAAYRALLAVSRSFFNLEEYRLAESQAIKLLSITENSPLNTFKLVALFYLGQICARQGNLAGAEWYTITSIRTALEHDLPLDVCRSGGIFLARLLHVKIMLKYPQATQNIFQTTQDWLQKGLQGAATPSEIENGLALFMRAAPKTC